MSKEMRIRQIFDAGNGILRMMPNWVVRQMGTPGGRLKLHPDDWYPYGLRRGAVKERWICSTVHAINGPETLEEEGLSAVCSETPGERIDFKDFVQALGAEVVGERYWREYRGWPVFTKFYDYFTPSCYHLHPDDEHSAKVGMTGKPEAYFFPVQMNQHLGKLPISYLGLMPGVTKEEVRRRLEIYAETDNRMTELSVGYRMQLGTGWDIPAGILHAPASICTYEPQWASDVCAVFENNVSNQLQTNEDLAGFCPEDKKRDLDYIMELLDWEGNTDPSFILDRFRPPIIACQDQRHTIRWITYRNEKFSAQEITVNPGQKVVLQDEGAYSVIFIQGGGRLGSFKVETPTLLRLGQESCDEFFVSDKAAKAGVVLENDSACEPMVLLREFGPKHPGTPE